jgi:hypothetical protein
VTASKHELYRQIEGEIQHLTLELACRQRSPRPPPAAVLRAYQLMIERAYRRLDELGA